MKKTILLLCFITLSVAASAQITSTFDTNADGWTFVESPAPLINHSATGGNPGGYVSVNYNAFVATNFSLVELWTAPAKFLGNHVVRSLDMNLRFDLQASHTGTPSDINGDVVITRANNSAGRIVFRLPAKPALAPAWTSYSLKLDETQGWRMGNSTGALATRDQIIEILTNVTAIQIRGTYATNASYISGLDNVILEQKVLAIAPVVSTISVTSGKPGDVITINGSGFNTNASSNSVTFGLYGKVKAVVQSASATQLTVVVPQNAPYGPITVTNTVTGLSTQTGPFNPVFDGGGRIIPASFKPKFDIPTIEIESISAADIDGDGWIDLAVTNDFSDRVIDIYRNLGGGGTISPASFATKVSIAYSGLSSNDTGLWFTDLDGDGKPDAITSTATAGFVGVYVTFRNTSTPGNISFEAPEYWRGGTDESPIALVADLDGDGRPDFVSGEGAIPGGMWFNQNVSSPGNIEFGSWVAPFGLSVINGFSGANAGDLNGDGKPELVISNGQGQAVDILQNTSTPGAPSFIEAFQFGTLQYNSKVMIADMNLDGKNDLIYKASGEVDFHIRLNADTDGTLTAVDFATDLLIRGDLSGNGEISLADMNGDGKPDIVASDNTDFGVFENVFAGGVFDVNSLVPAYQYEAPGLNTGPTAPIAVDLNGDGKPEIFAGITNAGTPDKFTIYENANISAPVISLNTVSPLSAPIGSIVTITGNNFSTVTTENIVRFGSVRASVLTATVNQITVAVPSGAAYAPVSVTKAELTSTYHLPFQTTFSPGVAFNNTHFALPVEFTLTNADYDIVVADLDNNGLPDVVAEGPSLSGLTALFRNTHTTGPISTTSLSLNGTLNSAHSPRLEDLDGDGLIDMMSARGGVFKNNSTTGNISFQTRVPIANVDGQLPAFADFNQDGKTDIVVTRGGLQVIVVENRTTNHTGNFVTGTFSSFAPGVFVPRPGANGTLVTGDFDNDGYKDMIATNPTLDNISIFKNAQRPRANINSFDASVELTVGDNPQFIYTADFDLDGKLDVLIPHFTGTTSTLLILLHNTSTVGNISFNRIDLTNPSATTTATIADLDGDGKPEIITTSETGNRFSIFKNLHTTGALTAASFAAPLSTTVTAPRGITTGDLNLDGKPEIILTRATGFLLVYENRISAIPPLPPPTIITFTPLSAEPGTTVTINGNNYDPIASNNAVYFGAIAGTITNASATQLSVTIPIGAPHGPITVINKATGLSKRSEKPFNPTFAGGGRIIPASFKPRFDILLNATAGNELNGLATADLDGDGWNDLIAIEAVLNTVSIFRNLGSGGNLSAASFAPKFSLATASSINNSGLHTIDLDGDGKLDIVTGVVNSPFAYFATQRNTSTPGNLSFEPVELWQVPVAGNSLVSTVIDVDGDGRPDLIGQTTTGSVSVDFWIAQNVSSPGNIAFVATVSYFGGSTLDAGSGVSTGDLDNDGKPDLIVKHQFGSFFSIIKNNSTPGTISLDTPIRFTLGSYGDINIADFNGDGKNDIAWKDGSGNNDVRIRINTHSGGALAAADFATEVILDSDLTNFGGISVADVNGDGKPDIIAADAGDFGVFENKYTSGIFDANAFASAHQLEGSVNVYPIDPIVTDLNGDQKPEIILGFTNSSPVRISIYENKNVHAPVVSLNTVSPLKGAVGSTVTITGSNFSTVPSENKVWFGGVESNVLSATTTEITAAVPAGAGYERVSVVRDKLTAYYHLPFNVTFSPGVTFDGTSFLPPVTLPLTSADYDVEVADLNNDGKLDMVAESDISFFNGLSYRNIHTTGVITASSFILDDTTSTSAQDLKILDVDGDGKPDILSSAGIYKNSSITTEINFDATAGVNNIRVASWADFNQDGMTDLVSVTNGSGNLSIYENGYRGLGPFVTGTFGTFSAAINLAKPAINGVAISADFDNDGLADVASNNAATDNISIWRNTGAYRISTSQFSLVGNINAGDNPGRVYAGDLDVDGKMDLMLYHAAGTNTNLVSVFHNQSTAGSIVFNKVDFTIPAAATVAHIRDLDGDGKPEIIVTSESTDQFFILKNTSTPGIINASSFATPFVTAVNNPRGLTTGDLNADGKPEIIITSAPNLLLIFENVIPAVIPPTITSFTPISGPTGTTVTITGTNFSTTPANNTVAFNGTTAVVTASTTTSITTTVPTGATTGAITVTVAGNTATSATNFTVTASPIITITTQPSDFIACVGQTATFTTTGTGTTNILHQWQYSIDGTSFANIANNVNYSGVTTSTLSVNVTGLVVSGFYRCKVDGDLAATVYTSNVTLSVNTLPAAPTVTPGSSCAPTTVTLNASGGSAGQYRWYTVATGGTAITGEVNSSYITPILTATTSYFVAIDNGSCESSRTPVVATINIPPQVPVITSSITPIGNALTICSTTSLTLTAPSGFASYNWSTGATTQQISVSTSGNYSVSVTDAGGCVSPASISLVVTVTPAPCNNQAPVISTTNTSTVIGGLATINLLDLISDADNNLAPSSLSITQQPASGALAAISNGILEIDYQGLSFSGRDQVTIQVCDVFGECTQQSLEIDVIGEIEIYNGISPNNDDQNEIFLIRYIDLLPDTQNNKVTIFNRWGSKVFEVANYNNTTNVFRGLNNNGNELPSGTYFFMIEFISGRNSEKGYLAFKR